MSFSSDFSGGLSTPSTTYPNSPIMAVDPETLEGQQVGAILRVKWISKAINHIYPAVGDHVKILTISANNLVDVENLRTGVNSTIKWEVMFPVPYYGKCLCLPGTCVCIYRSYHDFVKQHPTVNARCIDAFEPTNPHSRHGQMVGAIMVVKQKPLCPRKIGETLGIEVGDYVEVLSFSKKNAALLSGRNLRTGAEGNLYWNAFKWVGKRQVCGCDKQTCNCRYNDFAKSMAFQKAMSNGRAKMIARIG